MYYEQILKWIVFLIFFWMWLYVFMTTPSNQTVYDNDSKTYCIERYSNYQIDNIPIKCKNILQNYYK
jgi:hypothetical protein